MISFECTLVLRRALIVSAFKTAERCFPRLYSAEKFIVCCRFHFELIETMLQLMFEIEGFVLPQIIIVYRTLPSKAKCVQQCETDQGEARYFIQKLRRRILYLRNSPNVTPVAEW